MRHSLWLTMHMLHQLHKLSLSGGCPAKGLCKCAHAIPCNTCVCQR